jgi:hypothetical protein
MVETLSNEMSGAFDSTRRGFDWMKEKTGGIDEETQKSSIILNSVVDVSDDDVKIWVATNLGGLY